MQHGEIVVEIQGGEHLKSIVRNLKEVGEGQLALELKRGIRKAAKPMVPAVRRNIRNLPSKQGKSSRAGGSLRADLSKAVKLQIRTTRSQAGITIRVDGRYMPEGMKSLPAYMEGRKAPWRHPVYGNPVWATQPSHPYFYKIVPEMAAGVKKEIDAVATRIARKLQE
jgi:hypothetical protein